MLRVAPSVMVPQLMGAFHIGATQVGLLTAAYYYAYTPMQLVVGTLIDTYGTRKLLSFAALTCMFGSLLFNIHVAFYAAELGRLMCGVGSAFAFVGVMKLTSDWLPGRYFPLVSGLTTTLGMVGAIVGETFLSRVISHHSADAVVMISATLGLLFAILLGVFLRDRNTAHRTQCLREQLKEMSHHILKVIKHPQIWVIGFVGGALFMPNSVFSVLWGIPYLQTVHHLSKTDAAFTSTLLFYGWGVGSPLVGWMSNRFGCKRLLIASTILATLISLVVFGYADLPYFQLQILLFLMGFFCSAEILVFAMAHSLFPKSLTGTVMSVTNMLLMTAGALLQPLVGYLLDLFHGPRTMINGVAQYTVADFNAALMLIPILLFIAMLLAFRIDPRCNTLDRDSDAETNLS